LSIPDFVAGGILPAGIHDCDLSEIEATFVYNSQRKTIWDGATSYLSNFGNVPEVNVVYFDGSFVTDKVLPNDVDIVLEFADAAALRKVAVANLVLFNRHDVKTNFKVDLLFRFEPLPPGQPDLREFFQYLRPQETVDRGVPAGTKKGILKVSLR
jgi:hypothetical protein